MMIAIIILASIIIALVLGLALTGGMGGPIYEDFDDDIGIGEDDAMEF